MKAPKKPITLEQEITHLNKQIEKVEGVLRILNKRKLELMRKMNDRKV